MADALSEIFEEPNSQRGNLTSPENLFGIMETLDDINGDALSFSMFEEPVFSSYGTEERAARIASRDSRCLKVRKRCETGEEEKQDFEERRKKLKFSSHERAVEEGREEQPKVSHITVERNRRKQMNEHLVVLRALMPSFYVKRGDQASIIGGVIEYIKELQQLLKSLEAKKQRKVYSEVLSPRPQLSSPLPLNSPRSLPPRLPLPTSPRRPSPLCSPRTPQPVSPYKPKAQPNYRVLSPSMASSHESSSSMEVNSSGDRCMLAPDYRISQAVDVEVKLSGPNVVLKTISQRIPGQALKIIGILEGLALEILQVSISSTENSMLFAFIIKIGIECVLSAEELAQEVQQSFP